MTKPAPRYAAFIRRGEDYWIESRRPLASLIFIAPLLVIYEAGVLVLGPHAVRNGADFWMRKCLDALGFGQYFLLPVLTVCILLAWHYLVRQSWRISTGILSGMAVECIFLAVCLRLLGRLQGILLALAVDGPGPSVSDTLGTVTGYLGAGIYEELLFRLILLGLTIGLLRWAGAGRRPSTLGGILAISLLFAVAHYVGPYGESLVRMQFVFRFFAGIFFSVLFLYRGFGIAAGTHALYDVLV